MAFNTETPMLAPRIKTEIDSTYNMQVPANVRVSVSDLRCTRVHGQADIRTRTVRSPRQKLSPSWTFHSNWSFIEMNR